MKPVLPFPSRPSHWTSVPQAIILAGCTVLLASCGAMPNAPEINQQAMVDHAQKVGVFVSAHPDDEMQMWSLIDNTPGIWPIFVYMTEGEATNHCENASSSDLAFENPGFDPGEQRPNPIPRGKGSDTCKAARINSLLTFFNRMSTSLPQVPGNLVRARIADLDTSGLTTPTDTDTAKRDGVVQPQVWLDPQHRGAVVVFDMGDGALTPQEVNWAVESVITARKDWGLPQAKVEFVAGNYFNNREGCYQYLHADHQAVHEGIRLYKQAHPDQTMYLATCDSATVAKNTPVEAQSTIVQTANIALSDATIAASWGTVDDGDGKDTKTVNTAAHPYAYGWLWPGHYPLDRTGQTLLFQVHQSFVSQ